MPGNSPIDEDQKTLPDEGPGRPAHSLPDESTLLLPTPEDSELKLGAPDTPIAPDQQEAPQLVPGESLAGRFTILRFIARGGMGAVYEADDRMLKTHVALKVIGGRIGVDATELERFRREVLLSRRVSHPNVCRVYELYEADTQSGVRIQFLTMEFLEGETLARRIALNGPFATSEMLPLVKQMCAGLAAAHAEGVIHRDFKSSNVILVRRAPTGVEPSSEGEATRVVITDFGVARALGLEPVPKGLSGSAAMVGTPDYMAPEQITGGEVMPATDIYGLGVVLYEMVTGQLPFAAETPLASALRRLNETPPHPEVAAPGLDKRWAAVIRRCMARQPDRRFKSAHEVISALERSPRRRIPRLAFGVGAVVLVLLGVFALVRFRPSSWLSERLRTFALPTSRPVLAIVGFRNELPLHQPQWLPTAVSELVAHELGTAETSLRVIPTDRVAKVRRSLGLSEDNSTDNKALLRMQGLLAANSLVFGSLTAKPTDPNGVSLSIDVVDAQTMERRGTFTEDLGTSGGKLPEAVVQVAARIRKLLGVSLSPREEEALSLSRVQSLDAVRAYAQGVMSLNAFDYDAARGFFEAARAGDSNFLEAQMRIIDVWERQANAKKVVEAIQYLRGRKSGLTPKRTAVLDEKLVVFGSGKPDENVAAATFEAMPDDVELALSLASRPRETNWVSFSPKTALAMVQRLRKLPEPVTTDLRLDIAEARAAGSLGETKRAQELLGKATARAKELGARTELGWALRERWHLMYEMEGQGVNSLGPLREAEQLFAQAGELDEVAQARLQAAMVLSFEGAPQAALSANDEAAAIFRKLGNRTDLLEVFLQSAYVLIGELDLEAARHQLEAARVELEALGEPLSSDYYGVQASLAVQAADLASLRQAAQGMRALSSEISALVAEGRLLREEDHLSEARESLIKAAKLLEQSGSLATSVARKLEACALDCDSGAPARGLACLTELSAAGGLKDRVKCATLLSEARCKYWANDLTGAARAAREAFSITEHINFRTCRVSSSVLGMRIDGVQGKDVQQSILALRAELAELESKHAKMLAMGAAIALGEVELRTGRPQGRARLLQVEQEAKSRGLFRTAREARRVIAQTLVSR